MDAVSYPNAKVIDFFSQYLAPVRVLISSTPLPQHIQDEVQKAVSSMQEVTKRVDVGVGLSTQAGSALHNIVKSVNDLQAMIQQVAAATEEMSTVSETIGGDIEKIAVFSKETSTSAGEMSKSSTDLARLASNLQGIVTHFKIA